MLRSRYVRSCTGYPARILYLDALQRRLQPLEHPEHDTVNAKRKAPTTATELTGLIQRLAKDEALVAAQEPLVTA